MLKVTHLILKEESRTEELGASYYDERETHAVERNAIKRLGWLDCPNIAVESPA